MKISLFACLLFIIVSCSPQLNYLGDEYPPTTHVDTYYDEGDIKQDFKVIGQLSGSNETNTLNSLDDIKKSMINEAKKRGADGIWFLFHDSAVENHLVQAKLIKYL